MDFLKKAEIKFGQERAEQLKGEIEKLAMDIDELRAIPVDLDEEP
jgi:hypothetical protein